MAESPNPNRARDHLANERTFLAWVRTGAAIVVFGFAIGRFSIAMRQLTAFEGHPLKTAGLDFAGLRFPPNTVYPNVVTRTSVLPESNGKMSSFPFSWIAPARIAKPAARRGPGREK